MIVKTTKQIWEDVELFLQDPNDWSLDDKQEWVCLDDLKKEIEVLRSKYYHDYDIDYEHALNDILNLCNSPEQKEGITFPLPSTKGSVSGEHNTGEGDGSVISQRSSSPVQNPYGTFKVRDEIHCLRCHSKGYDCRDSKHICCQKSIGDRYV